MFTIVLSLSYTKINIVLAFAVPTKLKQLLSVVQCPLLCVSRSQTAVRHILTADYCHKLKRVQFCGKSNWANMQKKKKCKYKLMPPALTIQHKLKILKSLMELQQVGKCRCHSGKPLKITSSSSPQVPYLFPLILLSHQFQ